MEIVALIFALIAILAGLVWLFDMLWDVVKMVLDTYKHHPNE